MGSIGKANENGERFEPKLSIADIIKQLPAHNKSKVEVENPLYRDDEVVFMAFQELNRREDKGLKSDVYTDEIFTDRIISTQPYLNKNNLLESSEKPLSTLPQVEVIKYQDEYILTDGNHRTIIAKMNSVPKIKAQITDLDRKGRKSKR